MIVVFWTLAAAVGTLVSGWNAWEARRDLAALGDITNGRRIIAVGWVRREGIRLAIQAVWLFIGILSLPSAGNSALTPIAMLLVATTVAVTVNTVMDARDRIRLRRILDGG